MGIASAQFSFDPCDSSLCNAGETHVACGNSGNWSPSCAPDKKLIPIDEDLKSKILATHNKWRNTAAQGKSSSLPGLTASKMATIQWDDELAKLAELNIKKCIFAHDQCENTKMYKYVGQNIGISAMPGHFQDPTPTAVDLADSWYSDEIGNVSPSVIKSFKTAPPK